MIAILGFLLAGGIAFYCYRLGYMNGFGEGLEEADQILDKEIKRMKKENEKK